MSAVSVSWLVAFILLDNMVYVDDTTALFFLKPFLVLEFTKYSLFMSIGTYKQDVCRFKRIPFPFFNWLFL